MNDAAVAERSLQLIMPRLTIDYNVLPQSRFDLLPQSRLGVIVLGECSIAIARCLLQRQASHGETKHQLELVGLQSQILLKSSHKTSTRTERINCYPFGSSADPISQDPSSAEMGSQKFPNLPKDDS